MTGGLYEIRHIGSNRRYIGSSQNLHERFCDHRCLLEKSKHPNIHLQRAWINYGPDAFLFRILAILEKDELVSTEQRYLDRFLSRGRLYNLAVDAVAPMKGRKFSKESKQKIRRRLSNPAVLEAIANTVKSAWANPEVRQKYVDAARKRWASEDERKRMSEMKKELYTDPAKRERMSIAQTKAMSDPAVREKIAASKRGSKHTPETRAKMSISRSARREREASI